MTGTLHDMHGIACSASSFENENKKQAPQTKVTSTCSKSATLGIVPFSSSISEQRLS
jgi:hypothetical protein